MVPRLRLVGPPPQNAFRYTTPRQAECWRKREEMVAILPCGGGAFSTLSLNWLSYNECRRWLLTKRRWVRISFAEPNISTTNSKRFWLTAVRREFDKNWPILREMSFLRESIARARIGRVRLLVRSPRQDSQPLRIGLLVWSTALGRPGCGNASLPRRSPPALQRSAICELRSDSLGW
jgi:hypothetical protein